MVLAAQSDGGEHIFFVAWDYDANWNLAIIRSVGGVEGAGAAIEANLAADVSAKILGEFCRIYRD